MEEKIQADLKEAMKARDQLTVQTLRMLVAALKNRRIENKGELSEDDVLAVLRREVKARKEAASQYDGKRPELAEKERAEQAVLEAYLPAELSDDELQAIVVAVVDEVGATSPGDLGKVMGPLMGRLQGRADGNRARQVVQELLKGG